MKKISAALLSVTLLFGAAPSGIRSARAEDAVILTAETLLSKGSTVDAHWEPGEFEGEKCAVVYGAKTRETTGSPVVQYIFGNDMDISQYRFLVIDYYRTGEFHNMSIKLRTRINGGSNFNYSLINVNNSWHRTVYELRSDTATTENLWYFQYKPFGEGAGLENTENERFYLKSIGFYKSNPLSDEEKARNEVLQKEFDERNIIFAGAKEEYADFSELDGYERTGELLDDPSFENTSDIDKKKEVFENLISNSDFEAAADSKWYIPGNQGQLIQSDGGTTGKCLKIIKRESGINSIACDVKDILKKYGQGTYRALVKVKTDKDSGLMGYSCYIGTKYKGSLDQKTIWQGSSIKISDNWLPNELTFNALWNGELSSAMIYFECSTALDDYYIDDFELYKISDAVLDENNTSWTVTSEASVLTKTDSGAYDGKYCVKISERTDAATGISQNITKALNDNGPGMYSVSAYIKTDPEALSLDLPYIIYLRLASDGGTTLEKRVDYYMSADWQKIYFVFDLQWEGKVTNALFSVRGYDNTDKADFYIDNCSMFKYIKNDYTSEHTKYIDGYENGEFKPDNNITRAEAASIIGSMLADADTLGADFDCNYADIPENEWYSNSVKMLSRIGVLNAFEGEYFMPGRAITRAELVTLINKISLKKENSSYNTNFSDVTDENAFKEEIRHAAACGIVNGYDDGTFRPYMPVTRAETVTMINKALDRNAVKSSFYGIKLKNFKDVDENHWAYSQIAEASNDHKATVYDKGNGNWLESWKIDRNNYDNELAESVAGEIEVRGEALKQEILNAEDNVEIKGTTYYVSNSGNDENSGLSPDEAWATADKVNDFKFSEGDGVLFERGGRWWGVCLLLQNGVTYAAYGNGNKPELFGTAKNYASPEYWKETDVPNVWETTEDISGSAGFILFEEEIYTHKVKTDEELSKNFDFSDTNYNTSPVKLYYDGGNPGNAFKKIYIAPGTSVINAARKHDIRVDNLAVMYTGWHGFKTSNVKNMEITNCVVGWIGGAGTATRWGNGIEFWENASDCSIDHCWVYQVYDTGVTNQSNGVLDDICIEENISYTNNLLDYCSYSFEFFMNQANSNNDMMKNIRFEDNISRYGGYGWGNDNRPTKDTQCQVKGWVSKNRCENIVIRNNWFGEARYGTLNFGARPFNPNYKVYFVVLPQYKLTIDNNTYIEKAGGIFSEYMGVNYNFGYNLHSEFIRDNVDKNARIVLVGNE